YVPAVCGQRPALGRRARGAGERRRERIARAMKYYAVDEIEVTDPAWVRGYVAEVTAMVRCRGGRYLARREDRGAARAATDLVDHRVALQRGGRRVLRVRGVPALPRKSPPRRSQRVRARRGRGRGRRCSHRRLGQIHP